MSLKRAKGCLYGQLIGDALGCRYEFKNATDTQAMIAKDIGDDNFLPILGGGHFRLPAGRGTDDSEMAFSLASSLCRRCRFDPADIACAYVSWEQSIPIGIGRATRCALYIKDLLPEDWMRSMSIEEKQAVREEIMANAIQHNKDALSNGCMMRISPLAIASTNFSLEKMKEAVRDECVLTHCAPICVDATTCYVVALRCLIDGGTPDEAYQAALDISEEETVKDLLKCAAEKPIPVKIGETFIDGDAKMQGYIGVALQSAFYELLHAPSFYEGLVATVSRGGDADTNGCIVAAMLGARFGVDEIPKAWIESVTGVQPRCPDLKINFNVEKVAPQLLNPRNALLQMPITMFQTASYRIQKLFSGSE